MSVMVTTPEYWESLALQAKSQFELQYGVTLTLEKQPVENFESGFCLHVSTPPVNLLGGILVWRGILGGNALDDGSAVFVSLTMFPYLDARRLVAQHRGDLVEYRFQVQESYLKVDSVHLVY